MPSIEIRPDRALEEIAAIQRKMLQGAQNLMEVSEISAGVTPRELVWEEDKLKLYRYRAPEGKVQNPIPLLIVYALVNRPYMVDIQENRSTVRGLLNAGLDVYLLDWGYPDATDRYLTLDDYINGYIDRCMDVLRKRHRVDRVNLLGICQGGAFSLCYSALHPEKVANLVTMVTPVDFQTPDNMLSNWVRHVDVDLLVRTVGNIPGEMLNWTFLNLKPYRLMGQKYLDMLDAIDTPERVQNFMRMEKWIFDSPDQAGEAYKQFIQDFYQKNLLVRGGLRIGSHEVDLKRVTMPVLNIFAEQDHLVPPDASRALRGVVGTRDYTELSFRGGHIGIYVSGQAQKEVPPAISQWLQSRS
jgi:polyhydroxyalkanoate synthase subunit PhaC